MISKKIISKKQKFQSKLFTLWEVDVKINKKKQTWETVSLNGVTKSVMIIPITSDNKIILIKKFCTASNTYEYVLPGGKVEREELLKQTAKRELIEEIGFEPKELIPLGPFKILPAYLVGTTYGFIGKNLKINQKYFEEEIEILKKSAFTLQEILEMIKNKKIRDVRTVAILLYFFTFFHCQNDCLAPQHH
ncbi:MAG: NUDIX hydrolase [Patescibacteria group bacterium]|nr:NUDIX hydrolase [Patescibacteria group bacterium]